MTDTVLRGTVLLLRAAWLGSIGLLLLTALGTRLGPLAGHELFVVRGASMSPAIPVGSLVVASRTDPATVQVGDVATFRGTNGVVVTHRVVEVIGQGAERTFTVKGDGNATADPVPIPGAALIGVVRVHIPFAGYIVAMQSRPMGLLSLASGLLAIYIALSLLEERPVEERPRQRGARPHGIPT